MNLAHRAFLLKDSNTVVTDRSMIKNTNEDDYVEVTLMIPFEQINVWANQIKVVEDEDESIKTI